MHFPFRLKRGKGQIYGVDILSHEKWAQKKLRYRYAFPIPLRNRAIYRILCLMRIQALDALLCGCNQKESGRQTFSHKELSIYRIPNDSMPITIFK